MGLFREPMLRALLVLLLVIGGALWLSLETTRDYLQQQMQAHTQDSATTLALAMQPVLATDDLLTAETMVTALVQTGNYAAVTLQGASGQVLVEEGMAAVTPQVPALLMDWFPLAAPEAGAQISNGWNIVADVTLTGDTALAYQQLWRLALGILGLGAACMALATGLLWQWARGKQRLLDQRFGELGQVIEELRNMSMHDMDELTSPYSIFEQQEDTPPKKNKKHRKKRQRELEAH